MPHVGLKPTSAGLEAAAQSLYQWDKYTILIQQNLHEGKDSNPRRAFAYSFGDCPLRPLEHLRILKIE